MIFFHLLVCLPSGCYFLHFVKEYMKWCDNFQQLKSESHWHISHMDIILLVCSGHEDASSDSSVWPPTLTTQFWCSKKMAWVGGSSAGSGVVWIIMGSIYSVCSIRSLCYHVSRSGESATLSTASTSLQQSGTEGMPRWTFGPCMAVPPQVWVGMTRLYKSRSGV